MNLERDYDELSDLCDRQNELIAALRAQLAERTSQCVVERTPLGTPVSGYTEEGYFSKEKLSADILAAHPPNTGGTSTQNGMIGELYGASSAMERYKDDPAKLHLPYIYKLMREAADLIERLAAQLAEAHKK